MNFRNGQYSHQDLDSESAWQSQSQESEPGKNANRNVRQTMARSTKSHSSMPQLFQRNNGYASTRSSQKQMYPGSKQDLEQVFEHKTYPTKALPRLPKARISEQSELNLIHKEYLRKLAPKIDQLPQILPSFSKNQRQEYDGAGFALNLEEKDIGSQIQTNKFEKQKLQQRGFREWEEYKKIREGKIIVTIEYCTNCKKDHQQTTHHDEREFQIFANNLNKDIECNFPIIKIKMKPLLKNIQDQNYSYARSRIGAMEVQLCKNKNGNIQKVSIYSTLKTLKLPSNLEVLDEIRKYMDKYSLTIQINIDPFYLTEFDEEMKRTLENKLHNVEVILRPFKSVNNNLFLTHKQLNKPGQDSMGPQSASSELQIQTHSQLSKISQQAAPQKSQIEIKEKSNREGIVTFKDLPLSMYTLIIKGHNDFESFKDEIDIFKKVKQRKEFEEIIHYQVSLNPVKFTNAKITLNCDDDDTLKKTRIRIIKEGDEKPEKEGKLKKSEFKAKFKPGKYWVIIKNSELGIIERVHDFQFGNQELHFSQEDFQTPLADFTPEQQPSQKSIKKQIPKREHQSTRSVEQTNVSASSQLSSIPAGPKKQLTLSIYEIGSKNSAGISGCKIKIKDKNKKKKFITNSGPTIIPFDEFSSGTIEINHVDFLPVCEKYGSNYMNLNLISELSFPLIRRPTSENEVNFLFFTDSKEEVEVLTLHVIGPDGLINETNQSKGIQIETNPEQNSSSIKITKARETKGIYRIIAKVHKLSLLTPSKVKFYVITSFDTLNVVEAPMSHPTLKEIKGELYWDIGALYVPNCLFVEVNTVFRTEKISLDYLEYGLEALKLIVELFQKVKNREKKGNESEFRSILGFPRIDQKDLQSKNYLHLLSKEKIIESLSKAIVQKPDPLILQHLINSSLIKNNQYSYSKLRQKFLSIEFPEVIVDPNENSFHEAPDEDPNDLDIIDYPFYYKVSPEVIVDPNENSLHEAPDEDPNDLDIKDYPFLIEVNK